MTVAHKYENICKTSSLTSHLNNYKQQQEQQQQQQKPKINKKKKKKFNNFNCLSTFV